MEEVHGFVFDPEREEHSKVPFVFLIHGGPEVPWVSEWSYRWNPIPFLSKGYAVVMINPHGSPGVNKKYTKAVRNDWGGLPFFDLM